MRNVINCPFCEGTATLEKKPEELTYRKEAFNVFSHFYVCNKCNEEFTTNDTDTITILQAHNQYRERHSIPFVEEIISFRERYQLSSAKMSEVLGLGVNGFSNYEKGEIPTPAIGNLISTAIDNPSVFRRMLEKTKHLLSDPSFDHAIGMTDLLAAEKMQCCDGVFMLNKYTQPNSFTGYRKPNIEKLEGLLTFFMRRCATEFNDRIKLNKLLFYSDFLHYKFVGYSITGLTYRAVKYGPVPTFYDNLFAFFENKNSIQSSWLKIANGGAREIFLTDREIDHNLYSSNELEIIRVLIDKFGSTSSWDLVDISHKEKAWIDLHTDKDVINYQHYAFDIEGASI